MNFAAPQFLFGLLAISVPIIIHLFNFRKSKKVYFSSNKFLKKVNQETSSKRNLKHLLVLLSRIGFITFLVLAFARPYIPAEEKELQNYVQIYLDNSYSMSNEFDEGLSGLDHGIGVVNELLDQYPAGTRFRLITNDFLPFSNIFRSREEIQEILTELNFSKITREPQQLRERFNTEDVSLNSVDNYWISDFQQSIYSQPLEDSLNVRLVPIPFTGTSNIFVDSVYVESPFLQSDERIKLFARLINRGDAEVENLSLKVFINDIQATTNSLTVPPRATETAEFDIAFSLEEINRGRISFEDFPVTFDNEFYFVVNKPEKIRVVEIRGSSAGSRVSQVYGNDELFNFKTLPLSNLDYQEVASADLVILNEVENLDNSLVVLLSNYLNTYGNLAVFPPQNGTLDSYSKLLGITLSSESSTEQLVLASPDFTNPFYADVFEERNRNMKMPTARPVWRWYNDRDAILRFSNGIPFLSKINQGGSVYLFSSPLSPDFSDFPLNALFVPVMYKIAVSGSVDYGNLYASLSDEQFSIRLDSIPENTLVKLRKGQVEIIPGQRISGDNVVIDLPPTEISTGFYEVILGENSVGTLAFNNDSRESVLVQPEPGATSELFYGNQVEIFEGVSGTEADRVLYAKYQSTPLWKYAILISIMFLVAEILLFKLLP